MKTQRTIPIVANGERFRVPLLTDDEYDAVERLAQSASRSLDECPTCHGRDIPTESANHYGRENGRYKYRGEVHDCDCIGQMALYRHYMFANIPETYMRLNWDDYDTDPVVKEDVLRYIEDYRHYEDSGMGITFYGEMLGVGKTFAATTVAKAVIKKGRRVFFTSFMSVMNSYRLPSDERQIFEARLRESALLILDEVLPPTNAAQQSMFPEFLEILIRHRTNWNMPTIITTNMEDEVRRLYPRVGSLLEPVQWTIHMQGVDQRKNKIAEEKVELIRNHETKPLN